MKCNTLALGSLVASVAVAHPRHNAFHKHQRRDDVIEWVTDYVYTTEVVDITTTIWVSEGYVAPTASSSSTTTTAVPAQFFEGSQSSSLPVATSTSSVVVEPVPATTSSPPVDTTTAAAVPNVQTPVAATTSASPVVAAEVASTSSTTPASTETTAASSSSSGGSVTGSNAGSIFQFGDPSVSRETFYVSGSCGLSTYFVGKVPDNMPLVAMPSTVMASYGSSQYNTLCGRIVTITRSNGVTKQAAVADTNVSVDNSIDMTSDLWVDFGQSADDGSIIPVLTWSIA